MSYQDFLNKNLEEGKEEQDYDTMLKEAVEKWKALSIEEKADLIKEVKEEGTTDEIRFLKEVAEKAKVKPGTEAGGSGDETGEPIKAEKGGKGEDEVDDPNAETGTTINAAQAAGIGAGVGALSLAKKLRSEQAKSK